MEYKRRSMLDDVYIPNRTRSKRPDLAKAASNNTLNDHSNVVKPKKNVPSSRSVPKMVSRRIHKSSVLKRNGLKNNQVRALSAVKPAYKRKNNRYIKYGLPVIIVVLGVVSYMLYKTIITRNNTINGASEIIVRPYVSPVEDQAVQIRIDDSLVTKEDLNRYIVSPNLPRYLYIDSQQIKSRVYSVSASEKGFFVLPSNIHDVGWYESSPKPGSSAGAAIIVGRGDSGTNKGILSNLEKLKDGDEITIERGDGLVVRYSVVARDTYKADSEVINKLKSSFDPGRPGLNIIGLHNITEQQGIVVYAVQK